MEMVSVAAGFPPIGKNLRILDIIAQVSDFRKENSLERQNVTEYSQLAHIRQL